MRCEEERRNCINTKLKTIEENYTNQEIRYFYQDAKKIKETLRRVMSQLKNKGVDLTVYVDSRISRQVEHFDEILNIENYEEQNEELGI